MDYYKYKKRYNNIIITLILIQTEIKIEWNIKIISEISKF